MSNIDSPSDDISSEDEFHRSLNDLIRTAQTNDVDVRGGWRIDGDDGPYDLDVEIFRVVSRDD